MVQQRVKIDQLLAHSGLVRNAGGVGDLGAMVLRKHFVSAGVGGRPYSWEAGDLGRLMNETLM
jgi:hypothetical protein